MAQYLIISERDDVVLGVLTSGRSLNRLHLHQNVYLYHVVADEFGQDSCAGYAEKIRYSKDKRRIKQYLYGYNIPTYVEGGYIEWLDADGDLWIRMR